MNEVPTKTTGHFNFPGQTGYYRGKVRDVYYFDKKIVLIASDRISAFDVILPKTIPYKGAVLNQIAIFFLKSTQNICPNWFESSPDPQVSIGKYCEPIRLEMVVRGYLAGSAWRAYQKGQRIICGVKLPDGLKENEKLSHPIITPTTKADQGHDLEISKDEIIDQNILPANQYEELETIALKLFKAGSDHALKQGLLLVDTKYEFGWNNQQITLMDEIHTPDSSRYFVEKYYDTNFRNGQNQIQLSKEFVRQWLMEHGFQGREQDLMPVMSNDFIETISSKYLELYKMLIPTPFPSFTYAHREQEIYEAILNTITK